MYPEGLVEMDKDAISATELAARWSYAELVSPRFGHTYALADEHTLREKARLGVSFGDLSGPEKEMLRALLESHNDRRGFYPLLTHFGAYTSERWTYEQLKNLSLAPGLEWSRFKDFEDGKSALNSGADLRAKLDATPCGPFVQSDGPVIVVPCRYKGRDFQLLLEGTFRSLLFARDRSEATRLHVWVPKAVGPELGDGPSWL